MVIVAGTGRQRGGVLANIGFLSTILGLSFLICTPIRAESLHHHRRQESTAIKADSPDTWYKLGLLELVGGNLSGAEASFGRMLALGSKRGNKIAIAKAAHGLGRVHTVRARWMGTEAKVAAAWGGRPNDLTDAHVSEFTKAETMFEKSLALNKALRRNKDMAADYASLGSLYEAGDAFDRAEAMFKKSLSLNEALGRKKEMAFDYGNLGRLYHARRELDRAEAMIKKALALRQSLKPKEKVTSSYYSDMAAIYTARGKLAQAEETYKQALALADKHERYSILLALGRLHDARGSRKQGDRMLAEAQELAKEWGGGLIVFSPSLYFSGGALRQRQFEALQKAVPLERTLGHDVGLATSYTLLGHHHQQRGDLDEAARIFKDALALNEALGRKDQLPGLYTDLGLLHEKRGDRVQACAYWRKGALAFPDRRQLIELLNRGGCGAAQ